LETLMRRPIVALIAFWLGCLSSFQAEAAERVALIFGNGDYQNAPRLPNPVNDATDVASAFERLGFSVTLVKNGTFDSMRRALLDFAQQAQSANIAVLYFAGHGMEIRDENWLIPIDAELRLDVAASQEAVALASIMPMVSRARKLGLVILDACRDNPFGKQLQLSLPGRSLPSRGLASVEPPGSVLVAFAAKHGTTADDGGGRNSPFTTALLRNLETPGLEVGYLFRNVHDEVFSATQHRQEPYVYGTLSKEPIYLKPSTESSAPALSDAAQAWTAVKETSSPDVLRKFIESFGTTVYGELARERLSNLGKSQSLPARGDERAPPQATTATAKPESQTETAAPQKTTVALLPPVSPPSNIAVLSGRWIARLNCPIGSSNGFADFDVAADGSVTATGDNGDEYTGRMSGNSVSVQRKVDGGVVRARLTLTVSSNGRPSLDGTVVDSRLSFAPCSWHGTKH
jgi:Caspase domain